ncbi:hypothetical protein EU537_03305 [Candidatus Thorarchaeota archaeon]|nr:MAG: hypothetical protein EU537_03305 [Candidatus Thorarchaeota archaeon]
MLDAISHSLMFLIFLVLSLVAIHGLIHGRPSKLTKLVKQSSVTQTSLKQFITKKPLETRAGDYFVFTEESVYSISKRFKGRFDMAILHWEDSAILDVVFERKFPSAHLPSRAHHYDVFQTSLYALALMDSGVSCGTTKVVVIYCRQADAMKCQHNRSMAFCLSCDKSAVFEDSFSPKQTMMNLEKLDPYWFEGREPKASPNPHKCSTCPYASKQLCRWSKAKQKSND